MRSNSTIPMARQTKGRLRENGNVFLALFGAVAIVGVIGGTAAGIMKGPMKVMSDVSSRAVAENEIMANTKMGIMAIAQSAYTKDCDNDGTVEPYPYNSDNTGKIGGVPTGGGYLPSEIETTRWTDPWGNSYTYCVWDHGTLVDDASCGGAGQNRLPGLNKTTYPAGDVNKQVSLAVISAGANRRYETTCQDWDTADNNNDGIIDLLSGIGDTPLVNKPTGSDDIVMSYTYAEAAMATSSNWRIQSNDITTAEITEDEVEIGGQTAGGGGVSATIGGSASALGGLKLASDPGDDSITGACNPANDQALRINTGGASKALEICDGGIWTPISGSSTTNQCEITTPVIADSGNAWITDATKLDGAIDIEVVGDYAYAAGQAGNSFTVIDISDPLNPVIANAGAAWIQDATKLDGAFDIEIVGDYAYVVSNRSDSLTVIDISDPLTPVIANSGNAWVQDNTKLDQPWTLDIVGNYAYVSSFGSHSLTVIDISDPLNPIIANAGNAWVTDATKLFRASSVDVSGNYAYVTSREGNSFTVIDISDPLNPVIANAGAAWIQDATKLDDARGVSIVGNYAYVTSEAGDSFTVIDITDPLNPVIADSGNAWIQDATKLDGAEKTVIAGNYAFVASGDGDSFTVVDITDPLNPVIADSGNAWIQDATKLDGAFNITLTGNYAYVASFTGDSITLIDLGCDPTNPVPQQTGSNIGFDPELANCVAGNDGPFVEVDTFDTTGNAEGIWSDGTYIYVADATNGISAYTFNGAAFTEVANFATPSSAVKIWGDGTYIYLVDTSTLRVYSFNGIAFTEEGFINTASNAYDVWGDGAYVYVADFTSGVHAYSFDGSTLTLEGTFDTDGSAFGVWGDGTYLYVGDGPNGISAYTFDGSTFTEIANFDTPGFAYDVWGDATYLYVANQSSGVLAYTFDGSSFTEAGSFDTPGGARNIWSDGVHTYIADTTTGGIRAYTFNGSSFTEVDNFDTAGNAQYVWGDGSYVYVADFASGIHAFSGFECTKAGLKTPSHALEYDYTAEQLFEAQTSATGSAESYGTAILLKSNEFGDEAGFSVNVDSALGDDEIPSAAITAARTGINGEGALLFKTQDDEGSLKTNMMFDSEGDLGINTSAPFNVSGKIQIGDLASSGSDFFDPDLANCVVNNGGPFVEVARNTSLTDADGVWGDGTYIYTADGSGIQAFSFDGTTLTLIDNLATTGSAEDVWGDGTYLYTANGTNFIRAFTFDGTTLVEVGSFAPPDNVNDVWGDGTYIYAGSSTGGGIRAYTFNGTVFTELAFFDTPGGAIQLWGDGTYIYVADSVAGGVRAYTFDGTSFTEMASHDTGGTARDVWGDGAYIYVANAANGIIAFNFDGSTFTELGTFNTPDSAFAVWGDGTHIYVGDTDSGIRAYSFDGTTFTEVGAFDTPGQVGGVWGDGQYIYVADSASGLAVYSGFECTKVDGWQGPTRGLLTSIGNGSCDTSAFAPIDTDNTPIFGSIDVWGDGTYIYSAGLFSLDAFTFNGTTLTRVGNEQPISPQAQSVWSDGVNIYTGGPELARYTFNGTTFTQAATSNTVDDPGNHIKPWGDGTYVYSGKANELWAHNPTTLAKVGTSFNTISSTNNIWGDGTYIFTTHGASGIKAYTFNGAVFTPAGSFDTAGTASGVIGDGAYIYVADGTDGVKAFTYDGTTFTPAGSYDTAGNAVEIWADGGSIYVADSASGLLNFTFDGTAFTEVAAYDTAGSAVGIWGDGAYTYVSDSAEIAAFPYFSCDEGFTGAIGFFGNDGIGDVDTNILFSTGLDIKGTNPDGSTLTDILSIDAQGTTTFEQGTVDLIDEAGAFEFLSSSSIVDTAPSLLLQRNRGTKLIPLSIASGDILGALTWAGYDGSGIAANGNAAIYSKAIGAPSNGIIPNGLFFSTDAAGNALGSSDLALLSTGLIGVGTESPLEDLHVAGRIAMTEGLKLGYDNKCKVTYDKGFVRYNATDTAVEYCTAREWISITEKIPSYEIDFDPDAANCAVNEGGPFVSVYNEFAGSTIGVWGDGEYIYYAKSGIGLEAYTFDGTTLTSVGLHPDTNVDDVWGDGTYIYVSLGDQGFGILSFNGTTFTLHDSFDPGISPGYSASAPWSDGTYIYAPAVGDGLGVYSFNGSTITLIDEITSTTAYEVWGNDDYIFTAAPGGIEAFTFHNSTLTSVGLYNTPGFAADIWGDDNYIYVADRAAGVGAYTFSGSTFTEIDTFDTGDDALGVWTDGVNIFVGDDSDGIRVFTFDGTSFSEVDFFDAGVDQVGVVWGDGTYFYTGKYGSGPRNIQVFSGYACTEVKQDNSNHLITWDGIENTEMKITASDGAAGDQFGVEVDLNGNYIAVGAYLSTNGTAYIYDAFSGAEQHILTASDGASSDEFGFDVKIEGNYALVGSRYDDDNGLDSGSVYVFDITTGTEIRKLTPVDGAAEDQFGTVIEADGNVAIISSPHDDDNGLSSGSVYVFDITTGAEIRKLTPSDGAANDRFGNRKMVLKGNIAVISSFRNSDDGIDSGSVYIFDIETGVELFKLTASDAAANDLFGSSLAVSENYLLIASTGDSDNGVNSGSVYVFDLQTGNEIRKIMPNDGAADDKFGHSLSVDGKYAFIGSHLDDDNGADSGSVYIFDITTGKQIKKITPTTTIAGDEFARRSSSIEGNRIVVSAYNDDDNGVDAGAIYIYQGNWTDRHTSGTECYPNPIEIDNFRNLAASNPAVVQPFEITGNVKNCPLTLATDGSLVNLKINGFDTPNNEPFATINAGDLISITTLSSATADETYNNIITIGDQRALYTVHTAP